jgi:hypothetical protein
MWAPNDTRWLLPFCIVLAGVGGLLLYLHLSNAEETPKPRQWLAEKPLYICELPDWAEANVKDALEFVEPWSKYKAVVHIDGPCSSSPDVSALCDYALEEGTRTVPCVEKGVLLTKADAGYDFGTMEEGGHGDDTLYLAHKETGNLSRVTIVFPDDLGAVMPINEDLETPRLPADHEFLVVAHALLHAEGYEHVLIDLPGPFRAEQTGNIMNPNIPDLGRITDGLR